MHHHLFWVRAVNPASCKHLFWRWYFPETDITICCWQWCYVYCISCPDPWLNHIFTPIWPQTFVCFFNPWERIISIFLCAELFQLISPWTKWLPFWQTTDSNAFLLMKTSSLIQISLNFVPRGPVNKKPALVQVMAWCHAGNKPLHEPMLT